MAHLPDVRGASGRARAGQIAPCRGADPTFVAHLVEKYTSTAGQTPVYRSGLPIHQLCKLEDYVAEHLAEEISIELSLIWWN
jgi:hypothetical protein